jgi:filamentous hemagglutinin family protein
MSMKPSYYLLRNALAVLVALGCSVTVGEAQFTNALHGYAPRVEISNGDTVLTFSSAFNIIEFPSLHIREEETMDIRLPDAAAMVVVHGTGSSPWMIAGRLNCNGHLVLRNAGGVRVGPKANVSAEMIVLNGKQHRIAGTIRAFENSGKGGIVHILGDTIALAGNALLDVSGERGGGTILIGGDYQGSNPAVANAQRTLIDRAVRIQADATKSGAGGKVIVWSDHGTRFLGSISAKGAGESGNGGLVEVSGKAGLAFRGTVDVAAGCAGAKGTVLLDPRTITIQDFGPDINGSAPGSDDITDLNDLSDESFFGGEDSIITADAVNALLIGNNNLVLAAALSTTVNAAINGSGNASLTMNVPMINLNAPITLAGSGVLSGNPVSVNVGAGARIQNAVDVAAPGAVVNIAPGIFAENVIVAKSLILHGAKSGIDARIRDTLSGETIISGQMRLEAPQITFDGFTVRDSAAGAGIVANNAAGNRIINNYITANVFGLWLASDGLSPVLVRNNFFQDNTWPGSASGNGIYSDATVSQVQINANKFAGHPEGSVTFLGTPQSAIFDVEIADNVMEADGPISIANISDVAIVGNSVSANSGHAIWVGGGATDVVITRNLLHDNGGAGLKFARPSSSGISAASSSFLVRENSFQNNADGAIVVDSSEGSRYTGVLDASANWWGDTRGPMVASAGFTGSGNDVDAIHIIDFGFATDGVDFSPWLNTAINSQPMGRPGFDGDSSVLNISPLSPKATAEGYIEEALGLMDRINPRLQLFAGTYNDQAIINIPNTVAVILKGNVLLQAASAITFGATLDTDGTPWNLDAITPSLTLNGAVGDAAQLGQLNVAGDTGIHGGSVRTSAGGPGAGDQNYLGALTIGTDTEFSGVEITFMSSVNSSTAAAFIVDALGTVTFNGPVGNGGALGNLTVVRGLTIFQGDGVTTVGNQSYRGPVLIAADTILTSAGTLLLTGAVNADVANNRHLAVNSAAQTIFAGPVGNATALQSLTVSGPLALNGRTVTTTGPQTYDGLVSLGEDTTLTATHIALAAAVMGAGNDLTLNASGVTTFDGAVTGVSALRSDPAGSTVIHQSISAESVALNDDAVLNGGTIATIGAQSYAREVTLLADTRLNGTTIAFGLTVDGANHDLILESTADTAFDGAVNVGRFMTTAGGRTLVQGGSLSANNSIDIRDQLSLGANTMLAAPAVTLSDVIGNAHDLAVHSSAVGAFNGPVDGVDALWTDSSGETVINADVHTLGSQTFNDLVIFNTDAVLLASGFATFSGAVLLGEGANVWVTTKPNAISIAGAISGTTGGTQEVLTLEAWPGNVHIGGTIAPSVDVIIIRPPAITAEPESKTVPAGTNVSFAVTAIGTEPLYYEWRRDGMPIGGAIEATYTIAMVTTNHAGGYSVVVSNAYGTATSAVATLTVTGPMLTLAEAVDAPDLPWTTGGHAAWVPQTAITFDGIDAAQNGAITHLQTSWIETTVIGPGMLTYRWKVSSERFGDPLEFRIDNQRDAFIWGEVDWTLRSNSIPAGTHTLRWQFAKDEDDVNPTGRNRAWVDTVTFAPRLSFQTSAGLLSYTNGTFRLRLTSITEGSTVVIETSTNLLNWKPIETNTAVGPTLKFTDLTASNHVRQFYRGVER